MQATSSQSVHFWTFAHRGLSPQLARQVAEELTEKDVIRAHARDELNIDIDELANPLQVISCIALLLVRFARGPDHKGTPTYCSASWPPAVCEAVN